ncbi:hypothetical protein TCDM_11072 [Trypanosoma cruzi Dm28c]|uniref:Uncharacterized protein n=1 Tax=Trypanosoma cruzi Dm28c TaxID=1416333 RepID=V5D1J8_TRYCR|nr:hypothetical protein TCDM_11072 [Trypanosoma cruzi Dm28c]
MRVFPSGLVCAPSPLGRGVRVDAKVPASLFIASPLWLPSSLPEVLRLLDKMFWRRRCRSYRLWYFDSGVAVRRHCTRGFAALLFYLSSLPDGQFYTEVLLGTSVVTVNRMRQLFSAPFQCHIFLLIDGRHSVRRVTLIGLCGTARQRHRGKQAGFFKYLIPSCAQVFFPHVLLGTQKARCPELCVRGIIPAIWTAGNTEGLPLLLRRVVVSLRRVGREIPCSQLLLVCAQMLSLHSNNVLQRVRVLIGFVCTLILFAIFCGHATPEGGRMERGDAWPRPVQLSLHDCVVHIVVLTLRCDCVFLRGNGDGQRRVLTRGGTVGSCLLFFVPSLL